MRLTANRSPPELVMNRIVWFSTIPNSTHCTNVVTRRGATRFVTSWETNGLLAEEAEASKTGSNTGPGVSISKVESSQQVELLRSAAAT